VRTSRTEKDIKDLKITSRTEAGIEDQKGHQGPRRTSMAKKRGKEEEREELTLSKSPSSTFLRSMVQGEWSEHTWLMIPSLTADQRASLKKYENRARNEIRKIKRVFGGN
jgi:hypothetical protein